MLMTRIKRNVIIFSKETFFSLGAEKALIKCDCSEKIYTASSIDMLLKLIESHDQIDNVVFHLKRDDIAQFYKIYERLTKHTNGLILLVEPVSSHCILTLISIGVRYIVSLLDKTNELTCIIKQTPKYFFGTSIMAQLNILKPDILPSGNLLDLSNMPPVTHMEKKVFIRLISGLTAKEIGAELRISVKTVSVHKTAFLRKIGLRNINLLYKRKYFL